MTPLTPNPYSEFTTLYFGRRVVGMLQMAKSAAALGLLLVLYIVTSASLGAMTTEPQARATGFGAAPVKTSGGSDRAQVSLKAPREAVLEARAPSGDPTVAITTNGPVVSATVDGTTYTLPEGSSGFQEIGRAHV